MREISLRKQRYSYILGYRETSGAIFTEFRYADQDDVHNRCRHLTADPQQSLVYYGEELEAREFARAMLMILLGQRHGWQKFYMYTEGKRIILKEPFPADVVMYIPEGLLYEEISS